MQRIWWLLCMRCLCWISKSCLDWAEQQYANTQTINLQQEAAAVVFSSTMWKLAKETDANSVRILLFFTLLVVTPYQKMCGICFVTGFKNKPFYFFYKLEGMLWCTGLLSSCNPMSLINSRMQSYIQIVQSVWMCVVVFFCSSPVSHGTSLIWSCRFITFTTLNHIYWLRSVSLKLFAYFKKNIYITSQLL